MDYLGRSNCGWLGKSPSCETLEIGSLFRGCIDGFPAFMFLPEHCLCLLLLSVLSIRVGLTKPCTLLSSLPKLGGRERVGDHD